MAEGFEKLVVWQKGHALKLLIHREIVPLLPPAEKWDLADQIRRSSKSVTANLAEGYGRFYYRDMVRFCFNARGSLCETQNHLIDARDLQYIPLPLYLRAREQSEEVYRLLNGYIKYLKTHRPGAVEPGHDIQVDQPPPASDPNP